MQSCENVTGLVLQSEAKKDVPDANIYPPFLFLGRAKVMVATCKFCGGTYSFSHILMPMAELEKILNTSSYCPCQWLLPKEKKGSDISNGKDSKS
jgi:hypothetical protein